MLQVSEDPLVYLVDTPGKFVCARACVRAYECVYVFEFVSVYVCMYMVCCSLCVTDVIACE